MSRRTRTPLTDPRTPGSRYVGYSGEVDTVLTMWTDVPSRSTVFQVEGQDGRVRTHCTPWHRSYRMVSA